MKREQLIQEKVKAGLSPEQAAAVVDAQLLQDHANLRAEAAFAPQRVANLKAQLAALQGQLQDAESYAALAAQRVAELDTEDPTPEPEAEAKKGKKAK